MPVIFRCACYKLIVIIDIDIYDGSAFFFEPGAEYLSLCGLIKENDQIFIGRGVVVCPEFKYFLISFNDNFL